MALVPLILTGEVLASLFEDEWTGMAKDIVWTGQAML